MNIETLQMAPVKLIGQAANINSKPVEESNSTKTFFQFLTDSLNETNNLQKDAEKMDMALAAGKVDDISKVVVASEKAQIALNLTMSIRNKAVEAYQEIMRMQV
ncbi:flagellar hook-basal body complex protein FliE [Pectinatus cerevisiiphilus]|uniref:Flagellar hook-basal body complex protein FliE n=1 Tax=Pectinatus cerevisiiphilus TaxID=86956 RepID=A0A4R3KDB8_9FIRM|nr:flagellar hook-basal body complex protein FliE [Pectinatus cerevisiiphilus]TCS80939.1 flagellar hook-basal body complex protein FliE [Pectinatus cerevisiiphilus]